MKDKSEKRLLFSVTIKDCRVDTFRSGGPGGQNQFTILIGAYKKQKVWTPPDANKTAAKRRGEIIAGTRTVKVYGEYSFEDVSKNKGR